MSLNDLTTGVILKENIERYLKLKAMYDADKELQKEVARWKRQDNAFEYSRLYVLLFDLCCSLNDLTPCTITDPLHVALAWSQRR